MSRSFLESFAQNGVLVGIDGVESGEDHRLDFFEAGQWLNGGIAVVGDGVADLGVRHVLDVGDEEADFAGDELVDLHGLGQSARRESRHRRSFRST